jgi:hypothetical protein
MFQAGFGDFPGQSLSDLGGFGDSAAFCYQSRNIRAGPDVAAFLESLNMKSDLHFGHWHASDDSFIYILPEAMSMLTWERRDIPIFRLLIYATGQCETGGKAECPLF